MTGPEHYREAEELLAIARKPSIDGRDGAATRALATAQVHATLALAAATVIQPSGYGCDRPEWIEWANVVSVDTAQQQRNSRACTDGEGSI